MRSPPPLSRLPAYPVTGGVGLLATAVTLLVAAGRWDLARFEVNPLAVTREPWRLVISALPHVLDLRRMDVFHLPFNLYWLWLFGTVIEDVYGHVKTFALFLLLAAGSQLAEYALFRGGIGLSGVTYGLFGLLWYLAPRDRRFAGAVDARTTRLMVGWFFFCILTTITGAWAVANVAHGVGALLGVLVGVAAASFTMGRRFLATFGIAMVMALSWGGATSQRPRVNLAHDAHGSFQLGYQAIQGGRFDEAVRQYKLAVATDPKNAPAWYNLGIAYESTRRPEDAVEAYRRAYEIDPHDTRRRSAYFSACRNVGLLAAQAADHAKAVRYLAAATEVDATDGVVWYFLAQSYTALGKTAEAQAARDRAAKLAPQQPAAP